MPSPEPSRSRSPDRKRIKKSSSGFKWKEKRSRDDEQPRDERAGGRLERGYRDRSPHRNRRVDDSRDTEAYTRRRTSRSRSRDRFNNDRDHQRSKEAENGSNREDRIEDGTKASAESQPKEKKRKKDKKPKSIAPSEPMIIVNINDRLGTKAAIPCLASDSIKAFKAVVAAHIGRQPHEIMIKRQGERPMKDMLTLEDYGVSSGVQLDLEIDTGD